MMKQIRKKNAKVLVWACLGIAFLLSCDIGNPWDNVEQDPERYFKIDKLTVEPDTALMGVDTVTVTVGLEFKMNPFTKEEFDESVLKYEWSDLYLIDEDRGKTNSKIMRYFIPNDTTDALPIDIGFVVIELSAIDTITKLKDLSVEYLRLKRD